MNEGLSKYITYYERFSEEEKRKMEEELTELLKEAGFTLEQVIQILEFRTRWSRYGVQLYDPWADAGV